MLLLKSLRQALLLAFALALAWMPVHAFPRHGASGAAAATDLWDATYDPTDWSLDVPQTTATSQTASWRTLISTTALSGKKCAEVRITTNTSSTIVGIANSAFPSNHYLGNDVNGVGMQASGTIWNGGPNDGSTSFSITTGYEYVCADTGAKLIWWSRDLVTFYGASGTSLTAAQVAAGTGGESWTLLSGSNFKIAVAFDVAGGVAVLNGGHTAFNAGSTLPSGYSTVE